MLFYSINPFNAEHFFLYRLQDAILGVLTLKCHCENTPALSQGPLSVFWTVCQHVTGWCLIKDKIDEAGKRWQRCNNILLCGKKVFCLHKTEECSLMQPIIIFIVFTFCLIMFETSKCTLWFKVTDVFLSDNIPYFCPPRIVCTAGQLQNLCCLSNVQLYLPGENHKEE